MGGGSVRAGQMIRALYDWTIRLADHRHALATSLAEPDVSLMAVEYVENFAWSFIKYGQQSRTYERGKWSRKLFKKAIKVVCSIIDHILRVFLPGYRELRKT